eukprot:5490345-Amphidinium_carterae.2
MLHDLYDKQASKTPGACAVVSLSGKCARVEANYAEVCKRSLLIANGLRSGHLQAAARATVVEAAKDAGATLVVAVHLPRTHVEFLPLLLALSRCNATVVAMSTDLKAKELETKRNLLIIQELKPALLITSEGEVPSGGNALKVTVEQLCADGQVQQPCPEVQQRLDAPLYFMFTGGTTRGRCVSVTHKMFEHEKKHYPNCVGKLHQPRVLANTSVYWGASALGQVSIALAFGGCAVFCEAIDEDAIRTVITSESITIAGLVPDQLRVLATRPELEFPLLEVIFTWGEALPLSVAEPWRRHPRCKLRNLLISTECWLSLYSLPLEDNGKTFRSIPGVELHVITEDGSEVRDGEIGELVMSGPMVTPGYVQLPSLLQADSEASSPWVHVQEKPGCKFFRTRDLVKRQPGDRFEFCGRADMSTKERGQWIDLLDLEGRVDAIDGVKVSKLLPDAGGSAELQAFLVLDPDDITSEGSTKTHITLIEVRSILPKTSRIHLLAELPRHAVTQKVDIAALRSIAGVRPRGTWPISSDEPPSPRSLERGTSKARTHAMWTLRALACAAAFDA